MRPSLKIAAGILANLAMFSSQVLAYLPPINFDAFTAGTPIDLASPGEWEPIYGNSQVSAQGQGFGGSGKALNITADPEEEAWVRKPVSWNSAESVAFIDFMIKPAATPEGSMANFHANGSQLAFQLPTGATEGELWVLHGNDDDPGNPPDPEQWYLSAGSFTVPTGSTVSTDWVRVTLRHDYGRKLWDMFVDGKLVAVNLGFEGRSGTLQSLDFFGSRAGDTLIDNLQANPANMLFTDTDKDGLPDSWENANGSNPNLYDRDSIKPGTGKSFLDHYLDSLWSPGQTINGATGTGNIGDVPPLTVLAAHQPVASLGGKMNIGGDGSANYSVAIDVPQGTNGMQPGISLNYSSNGGNGVAGLGWSISGLQRIVRTSSTFRKDGAVDGVDFDSSDRFVLDGDRLVCVDGVYGQEGSVYRTEIDIYARITGIGDGPLDGGPIVSWKIETKSGLTMILGDAANSKISRDPIYNPPGTLVAAGGTLSWALTKVSDPFGNYYTVTYARDAAGAGEIRNQRIEKIEYTGYDGPGGTPRLPYAGIYFEYETRMDKRSFFSNGINNLFDNRLQRIRVKTGAHENHRYELGYMTSEQTGRSLLKEITKVANGAAMPKTTFEWRTRTHGQPKWVQDSTGGIAEYGSNLDSRGQISGHMQAASGIPSMISLTGTAWRAIPLPSTYTIKHDTVLNFQFRHTENKPPDFAAIGLDENLLTSAPSRLVRIVGSGTPPSPVIGTQLHTPVPSSYQNMIVPIGSLYGLSPGQTILANYLILVSDDNTADMLGVSSSTFYNVKYYETSVASNPTLVAQVPPMTYTINNIVPRMIDGQGDDLGVRLDDFTGDGRSDVLNMIMSGVDDVGGNVLWPETFGLALKRNGNEFVATNLSGPFINVISGFWQGGSQTPWARRARIGAIPVDVNADGVMDYAYPADIYKVNSLKRGHSHAFATCDHGTGGWSDMYDYRLPFQSQSNNAYHRFDHLEFADLNGDTFPDLLTDMDEGSLLVNGTGVLVNGAGTAWMNKVDAGLGWVRDDNMKLPKHLRTAGAGELGRRIFDANADGLPDYIEARSTVAKDVWLNTGTGFTQLTGWALGRFQLPVSLTNGAGDDVGTRFMDLNGDGLPDVMKDMTFNSVNSASAFLNTGHGWKQVSSGGSSDPWNLDISFVVFDKYYEDHPTKTSMADINADGMVDLVVANTTKNRIYFNTGSTWWNSDTAPYWATGSSAGLTATTYDLPEPFFRSETAAQQGKAVASFADVNGDGVTDYISDMDMPMPKVWINQNAPEVITAAVDGLGERLEVEYTRLNDPTLISNSTKPAYQPLPGNQSMLPGHIKGAHGGLIVTRLKKSDGAGGYLATRRHYGDLRGDRNNEAALGFGWVEIHDEHFPAGGGYFTRGYTRTETRRDYPFGGRPAVIRSYVNVTAAIPQQPAVTTGMKPVTEEVYDYGLIPPIAAVSGGTVKRPVEISVTSKKWDLDGTLMAQTVSSKPVANHNEHGFVTSSSVTYLDGSAMTTASSYLAVPAGATKWFPGRLTSLTVTKTAPGKAAIAQTTNFAYNGTTGVVESKTEFPLQDLFVQSTFGHDIYGNVTSTAVQANTTANSSPETRTTTKTYDTIGRFPIAENNGIGTLENEYDAATGRLYSSTDFDGRKTTFTYDLFGTQIAKHLPDGTDSAVVTRFVSNGQLPSAIQAVLASHNLTLNWARSSQTSGTPWTTAYFDSIGRKVVEEKVILTSSAPTFASQYTVSLYDGKGRQYKTSNPFMAGDPVYWTTVTYDCVDRPIRRDYPDGSYDGVEAIGNATLGGQPVAYSRIYDRLGNDMERWEDEHGRLVQSKDPSNQITTFLHNVTGNVLQVKIDNVTQLTNGYDLAGNRTSIQDSSAGTTTNVYNGFKELISVTSGAGHVTTTTYDNRGRPSTVTKPEGTYTTTYRTTAPAKGQALLVTGPGGYEENYDYGTATHDYAKVVRAERRQSSAQVNYITTVAYNALGLATTETDAGGRVVVSDYDSVYGGVKVRTRLGGDKPSLVQEMTGMISETLAADGDFPAAPVVKTTEALANGVVRSTYHDARNGRVLKIHSTATVTSTVLQNLRYRWDANGNLKGRKDAVANKTESFDYDTSDRLTASTITGQSAVNYQFAANGNLTGKGGTGTHTYSGYRTSSATIKGYTRNYTYDNGGQVTADGKRTLQWSSEGQLKEVYQASTPALEFFAATGAYAPVIPGITSAVQYQASQARATFELDREGTRMTQTLVRTFSDTSEARCISRYLGAYQIEEHASKPAGGSYTGIKTIHRHSIGGGALYSFEDLASGPDVFRLAVVLADHLGSTDVVLQADWDAGSSTWKTANTQPRAERQSFDSWGERRSSADWSALRTVDTHSLRASAMDTITGFTGHEMLDDFGLVHMNGRIYDSELGRFLSPDPVVQSAEYSQNYNRYSYVLNNPTSKTDPSGFFLLGLKLWADVSLFLEARDSAKEFFLENPWAVAVVAAVAGFFTAGLATAWITAAYPGISGAMAAAFAGAASGFVSSGLATHLSGGDFGDVLKSAFMGAISGFVTGFVSTKVLEYADSILNANTHATLYRVGPDGVAVKVSPEDVPAGSHIFGNGILTGTGKMVARAGERIQPGTTYYIIHNPSNGFIADMVECSLDKMAGQSQISRSTAELLSKMDLSKMNFYVHSQGGIIFRNAMSLLRAKGVDLSGVAVRFSGAAVNELSTRIVMSSYDVRVAGFTASPFDAVPNGAGYNALLPFNPYRIVASIIGIPSLFIGGPDGSAHTGPSGGPFAGMPWFYQTWQGTDLIQ